ncbi:MAG: TonB-dependent receptor [Steroidobacter sp.]
MHSSHSLRIAIAALLVAQSSLAQETRPEEVIVTSTALRETALDIAQPATVISGDELRRQIASSIGESIATEPGVSASYFGPSASRPVIRGLGGERVLMLQDGVSALDASSLSQDHAVAIESVLADQIEILKGPAALLFGSGAVGGVVNVVDGRIPTDFSGDADRIAFEVRGDTAMEERTGVGRIEFGGDAVRVHVDGFRRETADVEIPGYAFSSAERAEHLQEEPDEPFQRDVLDNSDSETYGGAFGVSVGGEQGFVGFAWNRFDTNYAIPGGHGHEEEGGEPEEEEEHAHAGVRVDMQQDRYDLKAQRDLSLGAFERIRLRGTYNDYTHLELEGEEIGTRFAQDAYDARLNLDHADIAGWRGTLGAQYISLDFAAFGEEAFVPPSITEQAAVFIFEKRAFGDVSVELGARAENQRIDPELEAPDYDETAWSLSAGGVWRFVENHSLALNLTRSQRHPQSAELYADGPHLAIGRFEIGDAALAKETANTIDLTLHRHGEGGVHWSAGVFYNDFADYIYLFALGVEQVGLPSYQYTQADAEFYGFEGEITLPVFEGDGGALEVRLASDYVRGKLKNGGDLPQIPPLRYGVELHYERERLHLGLEAYAYDDQEKIAADERATDGYTMLEADVSYRFSAGDRDLLVFLRGSNLLDEEARRHTSPLKEVAPLPGRSAHLGVRAEF